MGTNVELQAADAGDLSSTPVTPGKTANSQRVDSRQTLKGGAFELAPPYCRLSGFLLEETDCGSSRDALDTNTDLFKAKTIKCFLQHFRFDHKTIVPQWRKPPAA